MSAISHKVNTRNDLVNPYFASLAIAVPAKVHPEAVIRPNMNLYFKSVAVQNHPQY
jgi:hypothetical protein